MTKKNNTIGNFFSIFLFVAAWHALGIRIKPAFVFEKGVVFLRCPDLSICYGREIVLFYNAWMTRYCRAVLSDLMEISIIWLTQLLFAASSNLAVGHIKHFWGLQLSNQAHLL